MNIELRNGTRRCKECGFVAYEDDWPEGWVSCDLCGDHDAIRCNECDECYDDIFIETHYYEDGKWYVDKGSLTEVPEDWKPEYPYEEYNDS